MIFQKLRLLFAAITAYNIVGRIREYICAIEFSFNTMNLPSTDDFTSGSPVVTGLTSLLLKRRSQRHFASKDSPKTLLSLSEVGSLLFAAQGVTLTADTAHSDSLSDSLGHDAPFRRTAPSGGAVYPLEVYLIVRDDAVVENLMAGMYTYEPSTHSLNGPLLNSRDSPFKVLAMATSPHLSTSKVHSYQTWISNASILLLFMSKNDNFHVKDVMEAKTTDDTTEKVHHQRIQYGSIGNELSLLETGMAVQNTLLMASACNLAACPVGAIDHAVIHELLSRVHTNHDRPIMMVAVGPAP